MAKKKQNAPATPNPDSQAQAPIPGPAPSAEEVRRLHVETNAKDRLKGMVDELAGLLKGDCKKVERLAAIIACGESIMSVGLHTRGRLRAVSGRGDAFIESTAANVMSGLRKALKTMEMYDKELIVWGDTLEILKPVADDVKRIATGLDRPGVKAAVAPGGEALFDDEGQPTETAAAPPAPEPAPSPAPPAEPEPPAPEARPIQTLGMGPVIDVDVVEPEAPVPHFLDGKTVAEIDEALRSTLDKLEEAGVENGLKRKDWIKAYDAWCDILPMTEEDLSNLDALKKGHDLLIFALMSRQPFSWAVPTDKEFFDFQRKLAIAAGE